jgi:hypothetical protein
MGRPRVEDQNKRVVQVNVRLTEGEYKMLKEYAEASRATPANWIRCKVLKGKYPPPKLTPIETKVYHELNRIGGNINQAVHKLNEGVLPEEFGELLLSLKWWLKDVAKRMNQYDR